MALKENPEHVKAQQLTEGRDISFFYKYTIEVELRTINNNTW